MRGGRFRMDTSIETARPFVMATPSSILDWARLWPATASMPPVGEGCASPSLLAAYPPLMTPDSGRDRRSPRRTARVAVARRLALVWHRLRGRKSLWLRVECARVHDIDPRTAAPAVSVDLRIWPGRRLRRQHRHHCHCSPGHCRGGIADASLAMIVTVAEACRPTMAPPVGFDSSTVNVSFSSALPSA
jgi:hypothetical protein